MQPRRILLLSSVFLASLPLIAQDAARPILPGAPEPGMTANLPIQKVGPGDLLGLQVYDAPEFTRTARIAEDGTIRLPMLTSPIAVEGLLPDQIEKKVADVLKEDKLFVDPFVTVTIVEYHSRPVSVSGAVRTPTIFQAVGNVTLVDALARAGGLIPDVSGNEIVVTIPDADGGAPSVQHISAKALMEGANPELNLKLSGGEQIRVPDVAKIVVTGNVIKPGVYPVLDSAQTNTVRSAIGQAQGLAQYWGTIGYIYRTDDAGKTQEISVPLRKIMDRKAPDVPMQARDVLYVPDSSGRRITQETVTMLMGMGGAATAALIYVAR